MAIQTTDKIWHNGVLIPWNDAQIHVMSHVINYGSSVFEGIRCYAPAGLPAIFRLREHVRRMIDSAKIYRIENLGFSAEQLADAMLELGGDVIAREGLAGEQAEEREAEGAGHAGMSILP